MKIINQSKQTLIAARAELADTAVSRLVGLLGRSSLPEGQAMVITQCRSIHMLFMKFPIDVIFVDRQDRVVGLVEGIKPFALSPYFWRSSYVVEAPCGTIKRSRTAVGDILEKTNTSLKS